VRLASEDDSPIIAPDSDRLVAVGMPWRRDHENARKDLRLAVELAIVGAVKVNEARRRVIRGRARLQEFPGLDEDRSAGQHRVAAAMIEVQVTVGDPADVIDSNPGVA
jgi:hypothetical protein